MNNWLNQLERKYGRFGIPNLTNILGGGQILVLAIELFVNQTVSICSPGCWALCWPACSPA